MNAFDPAYNGTPPWDIGRPQREIVGLAQSGEIRGTVLDVGCGTGENVLYLAGQGHEVLGVDASPAAIEKAKAKAAQRDIKAAFLVWNVMDLQGLGRRFDTSIDSGLFHVFSDEERVQFAHSLATALRTGSNYYMICFSDKEPTEWGGPRRVAKAEIRSTFQEGWQVNYIRDARFETLFHRDGGRAWLSSVTKL